MTTETKGRDDPSAGRLLRTVAIAVPFVLVGWLAVLSLVARFSDVAPAYVVLYPSREFVRALPEDARIAYYRPHGITLQSEEPGFAARLYAAGALLVLPAGLPGCVPFTKDASAQS
ncbi:hypothetical protein [Primorskyibacter sp. S187A]|uniref:hypothetical protein n=1 Tax=Primorskyibacter sp. S187A TaxID=3415130 RepID=UPI003C7DECF6